MLTAFIERTSLFIGEYGLPGGFDCKQLLSFCNIGACYSKNQTAV